MVRPTDFPGTGPLPGSSIGQFRPPPREKELQKNPRVRSNESPRGAFKRQNGLAFSKMAGPRPDTFRRFFWSSK